ncbi:MAG: sialate O-acetylesterase [Saprospiraceae bacterium]|nr:sialate O-acetylesterase [Saprospiraceae bacterium]
MKYYAFIFFGLLIFNALSAQDDVDMRKRYFPVERKVVKDFPDKEHFWIFIMAGQSNMAGRGQVEPADTMDDPRILSLDAQHRWILAKEPLHYYEPNLTGLDCGLSFARTLLEGIPPDITVGILPCGIGGSSVEQWLGDSLFRGVHLVSNFKENVDLAQAKGTLKGIIWHQGESNAKTELIPSFREKLQNLFTDFREYVQNDHLPIVAGQLGSYTEPEERQMRWDSINMNIRELAQDDPYTGVIKTNDLTEKGDKVHFDSRSQRLMGQRFAIKMLEMMARQ